MNIVDFKTVISHCKQKCLYHIIPVGCVGLKEIVEFNY